MSAEKPFWTPKTLAAAGVVAAIAIAAIVLSLLNLTDRGPAGVPSSSSPAEPSRVGDCPQLPADTGSGTVSEAPATKWTLVGRMAAPEVADAGPAVVDPDGWRHCYARTPTGALVAAANYIAMTGVPELVGRLAKDGIMPGDLRDRALSTPTPSGPHSSAPMQFRGFRVVSFTPDMAVINLAIEIRGNSTSATMTLRWYQGDWRIGVRGEGAAQELDIDYGNLPSLYGYVNWAGA